MLLGKGGGGKNDGTPQAEKQKQNMNNKPIYGYKHEKGSTLWHKPLQELSESSYTEKE